MIKYVFLRKETMNLTRYLVAFVFSLALIILALVLFFSNNPKTNPAQLQQEISRFSAYSKTNAVATLDINGPIVSPSNHNEAKISVSSTEINLQVMQGYDDSVIVNQTFPNSQNSFDAFLRALYINGFDSAPKTNSLSSPIGLCSLGDTYVFRFNRDNTKIVNAWITNCYGDVYTYRGNFQNTLSLFQKQVPNYFQYINNLNF